MEYLLSDGNTTKSKKLYLQDAIRFAFSVDSYSIPNSQLGIHLGTDTINPSQKLIFNNICKAIDPSLKVTDVTQKFNKIYVKVSYPYGNLTLEV